MFMQNVYQDFSKILKQPQLTLLDEINEIRCDFMPIEETKAIYIEPKFAVIGSGTIVEEFLERFLAHKHELLKSENFQIFHVLPESFIELNGNLGNFKILYTQDSEILTLEVSQVVFFTSFKNVQHCKGVYWVNDYHNANELIESIWQYVGLYEYHNPILFISTLCDFEHRRAKSDGSGYCHRCSDVCQSFGVFKDESKMEIGLSGVDCVACGDCVSVCPTGALQREGESLESFNYQAQMYKGYIPIIHEMYATKDIIDVFSQVNDERFLPFSMGQPHILNATYLLSLVQESGAMVILYGVSSTFVQESIDSINTLSETIFGKKCVLIANTKIALESCMKEATLLQEARYTYTPRENESQKEIFSQRAYAWVKNGSFGRIHMQHSGNILIDSDKCTLCLSCVDACNTKALVNDNISFKLLFKQSLCTGCGYCIDTCAEKVIQLESQVLDVESTSFEYIQKAYDEPFKCVECGKIFATSRSIQKIKDILLPNLINDPIKQKGIECCGDCKIKIIFGPKDNT